MELPLVLHVAQENTMQIQASLTAQVVLLVLQIHILVQEQVLVQAVKLDKQAQQEQVLAQQPMHQHPCPLSCLFRACQHRLSVVQTTRVVLPLLHAQEAHTWLSIMYL